MLFIVKFCFVPKIRWKSLLCSREISLKRPQIVTQTFARTLLDSYREQRMKFARYACITFAQYCNCTFFDMLQWRVIIKVRLVLLWVFWYDCLLPKYKPWKSWLDQTGLTCQKEDQKRYNCIQIQRMASLTYVLLILSQSIASKSHSSFSLGKFLKYWTQKIKRSL